MDDNLGFARGVNVAASSACGRYVLLLNPDAEVVGDVLRHLVDFADERPQHGVYGGRTLKPEGGLNPTSCWDLPSLWSLACFAAGLSSAFPRSRRFNPESLGRWQRDTVRTVGMVAGCLLLIRRSLWEQLGGFDTAFFMYGEDADLCARAAKLGCSPVITPGASIIHAIGASTDRRADKMTLVMKAKVTFLQKHWRAPRRAIGVALLRAGVGLRAGLTRLTGSRNSPWGEVWDNRAQWVGGYDGDGSSPRRTSESEPTAQPS
jgi:GT2 family glycosyltransferase